MAIYRNVKTGTVLDSPYPLTGDNWVLDSEYQENKKEEIIEEVKEQKQDFKKSVLNDKKIDEITKVDIIQELEAFGIEYNKKMTKKELIELLK